MKNAKREIRRLLHRASPARLVMLFLLVFAMVPVSGVIRYYAVEPVLLKDAALVPEIAPGTWTLFCKLASCKNTIGRGDFVLLKMNDGSSVVRQVLAVSGDHVKFTAGGFVSVNGDVPLHFENEGVMIADREFTIPQRGDSLALDTLSDIEFDYALNLLKQQNIAFYTEVQPFAGEDPLPLAAAGNTRIGSRPTSVRELPGLPWQELFLIAHQIRRNMHTTQHVYFKRQAFYSVKSVKEQINWEPEYLREYPDLEDLMAQDSSAMDSLVKEDSIPETVTKLDTQLMANVDSLEVETIDSAAFAMPERVNGGRIEKIAVSEPLYYLITPQVDRAADSREFGYIPKSKIVGKLVFKINEF